MGVRRTIAVALFVATVAGCGPRPVGSGAVDAAAGRPVAAADAGASTDAGPAPTSVAIGARGVFMVDGKPAFLIGLSNPPALGVLTPDGEGGIDAVTQAGVSLLRFDPSSASFSDTDIANARHYLDVAAAHGVITWVRLDGLSRVTPGSTAEARLRTVLGALRDNPGMGLWKGYAEPLANNVPADDLASTYQITDQTDPAHPLVIMQRASGTESALTPYAAVTDAQGVAVYPVAYGVADPDLDQVSVWTHHIAHVTPGRAVFVALQICFAGSTNAGKTAYVMPTRRQERYMIYNAIMSGARALVFFGGGPPQTYCMTASDRALGWNWTFWNQVLQPLIKEISAGADVYPALLTPGTGIGLTTNDSLTRVMSRQVGTKDIWVFLERRGTGTKSVRVSGLPAGITQGRVYEENRTVAVSGGAFTDTLSQWGVHVYHFVRP